jgi:hypothetical protein
VRVVKGILFLEERSSSGLSYEPRNNIFLINSELYNLERKFGGIHGKRFNFEQRA